MPSTKNNFFGIVQEEHNHVLAGHGETLFINTFNYFGSGDQSFE